MDAAAAKSASIAQDTGDDRAGEDGAARPAAVGAEILGDTGWSEAKLADGGAYYFKASGETTWDVPPEVVAYKQRIKGSETQEAAGPARENPAISGVSVGGGEPGAGVVGGSPHGTASSHAASVGRPGPPANAPSSGQLASNGSGQASAAMAVGLASTDPAFGGGDLAPFPPPGNMPAPPPQYQAGGAGMFHGMLPNGMPSPQMMMAMMNGFMGAAAAGRMVPQPSVMPGMPPPPMHPPMALPGGIAHPRPPPLPPTAPAAPAVAGKTAAEDEEERRQKAWAEKMEADKRELARRKKEFRLLLLEKGVSPGGVWEKELPKFCFDARADELLPLAADRKAVFKDLSRADVLKYKADKKAQNAEKRDCAMGAIKELLTAADLSATSTLADFWAMVQDDPRLDGIEDLAKDKKVLQLFNLRVEPLRAARREEENVARQEFLELLRNDTSLTYVCCLLCVYALT